MAQLLRDALHHILLTIMVNQRKQRKQELHILNKHPICDEQVAIWAVNHSCRYDVPITCEVIGHRVNILAGKQRLDFVDRICFWLNGVVWVDRQSAKHKKKASKKLLKLLQKSEGIVIYPEGTWNLEPSMPLLSMYWGCIDLAKQSGVPIIPLILEFKGLDCYAKCGTPIYVQKADEKSAKFEELKETMATLKWEMWEMFPQESRSELDLKIWDKEKEARITAYPKLDYVYEKKCVRKE